MPSKPVDFCRFVRFWNSRCSHISISSPGTDYCDNCTTLKNSLSNSTDDSTRNTLQESLEKHVADALSERRYLKDVRSLAISGQNKVLHLIMDFAEKVLLPSLVRQPGQLHFVTGLKLDLFAVSCGNKSKNYVFSLPEGYWPGGKTANEVLSMVFHVIKNLKKEMGASFPPKLVIHADNCAGQNKNRHSVWFCSWMMMGNLFSEVELNFLLPGHTKNECDSAFGSVKKLLRRTDVLSPHDMRVLIDRSSKSARCVSSTEVEWIRWKSVLQNLFTIPKELKLSTYFQFRFPEGSGGALFARRISTDSKWDMFNLIRPAKTVPLITDEVLSDLKSMFASEIPNLSEIRATKDLSRRDYLIKQICNRYYPDDMLFKTKLFSP